MGFRALPGHSLSRSPHPQGLLLFPHSGHWGRVMEGHRADGLWADLGKDSLPPGEGQPHISELSGNLGIVSFSRIPRTRKVNVGVRGGAAHSCKAQPSVSAKLG